MGVGILLYLVKHSRPEIANTTKELSKANDGANPAEFKTFLHVIKYALDMENIGLKIEPTWNANNPEKSYVLIVC